MRISTGTTTTATGLLTANISYEAVGIELLVTPKIEPFVRYDYAYLQGGSVSSTTTRAVEEFTLGANYYLYNQNAKFTVDGSYLPDGSPVDQDPLGILQDSGHNEFVLRVQFQLAI